ncbi:hypothetical protein [Paraburkholderia sp. GAS348]
MPWVTLYCIGYCDNDGSEINAINLLEKRCDIAYVLDHFWL